jgi:hypothetical protein
VYPTRPLAPENCSVGEGFRESVRYLGRRSPRPAFDEVVSKTCKNRHFAPYWHCLPPLSFQNLQIVLPADPEDLSVVDELELVLGMALVLELDVADRGPERRESECDARWVGKDGVRRMPPAVAW